MKINIPPILGRLDLTEYAPELGDQGVTVWLNPPTQILAEYDRLFAEVDQRNQKIKTMPADNDDQRKAIAETMAENEPAVRRMVEIISELLSQGPADTRIGPDDIMSMIADLADANPGFYHWMVRRIFRMIAEYRIAIKKN